MRPVHTRSVIAGACACLWLCGCNSPQDLARQAVEAELAERRAAREDSMRLYAQGTAAHRAGRLDDAQQCFTEAVAADERNAGAWMGLGMVEHERDNLFLAASAFQRAARLQPARYEPHFNIGSILESAGRYRQAIDAYERAMKLDPDQVEVMENLARCYIKSNTNLPRAKELVDRALGREERPEWRSWLREQSLKLNRERGLPP